jgi:hypothetical protein
MTFYNNFLKWFCFVLFLLPTTTWSAEEAVNKKPEKRIYTVIEFESTFMNRKKEKVLELLGEPNLKSDQQGREVWTYKKIIKDQEKLWNQNLLFNFGRVNMMWGSPPGQAAGSNGQ